MKKTSVSAMATLAILFGGPTQARGSEKEAKGSEVPLGSEKEIKRSDVPPAVLEAVKKKYGNARMVDFSKENDEGKITYEVTIQDGSRRSDLLFDPDGKILIEEHRITLNQLPKAVKDAFESSRFARAKVDRVERVIRDEKEDNPAYELVVKQGGEKTEIVFDQTGKLTKQSPSKGKKE